MTNTGSDETPNRRRGDLHRVGWSMQITTQEMLGGTGYNIFRCGNDFRAEIEKLVPWLSRARKSVLIADAARVPFLVITIEPLDIALEQEFISTVGRFLIEA